MLFFLALIVTAMPPYDHFVQELVGTTTPVVAICPPGQDPNAFTLKNFPQYKDATLFIGVGADFEKTFVLLAQKNCHCVSLTDDFVPIPLKNVTKSCCQHKIEVHSYLSPQILLGQIEHIEHELFTLFPQEPIEQRAALLKDRIRALDEHFRSLPKSKSVETDHRFAYMTRDYGIFLRKTLEIQDFQREYFNAMDSLTKSSEREGFEPSVPITGTCP